jgi:Spy/CpxP family protein refolding chaperone
MQAEEESTDDLREHHRHHHHGGFAMFVAMSLDLLGTTPEQDAAITKIQAEMSAKMQPANDAEKDLLNVLADASATGTLEKARVDAAVSRVSAEAATVHEAVADSLNQLHAILSPPERAALVDKVEAHFAVWSEANVETDAAARRLGRLAKELALSQSQVEQARTKLESPLDGLPTRFDRTEGDEHLKAFAKAFTGDAFDARTLPAAGMSDSHLAAWGATRCARFYEAVIPVLTPDQRPKLAELLRRHANYKRTPTGT